MTDKHEEKTHNIKGHCLHLDQPQASAIPSLAAGYTAKDMINFANFFYGTDIDLLDRDVQFRCKRAEGALEYWVKNVKNEAV